MSIIIPRERIGMRPRRTDVPWRDGRPLSVTLHYFGVDLPMRSEADLLAIWKSIERQDMDTKGYSAIMYNVGLSPFSPNVYGLRGLDVRGAANGSTYANGVSLSALIPVGPWITQVGHAGRDNIREGLLGLDAYLELEYGVLMPWVAHSDWRPTGCPGDWGRALLPEFNNRDLRHQLVRWRPGPEWELYSTYSRGSQDDPVVGDGYVHWIQRILNGVAGQGVAVDGIFGRKTEDAVKNLQRWYIALGQGGIRQVDGVVSVANGTWPLLVWLGAAHNIQ